MLKHMLTHGGGPQAAAAATVNGGGTRMPATATVVGIPSIEVRVRFRSGGLYLYFSPLRQEL